MKEELELSTFYLDLDVLMDTRLGTWALLGDESLSKALNQDYLDRCTDNLKECDYERFKQHYEQRDKRVLEKSLVTGFSKIIKDFVKKTSKQILSTPFHYKPKICLNIYPYQLTEEEINNFIQVLIILTDRLADVEVINYKPEMITPSYVKKNYSVVAMYDYPTWIEMHSANGLFRRTTCPEVLLLAPMIYFKPITQLPENYLKAFEEVEKMIRPLIGIKLIPVRYFSMHLRKTETA